MSGRKPILLREWLDALLAAMGEVASCALGAGPVEMIDVADAPPIGMQGSYLAIVGDLACVHIAVVALPTGCQTLGKSLLGLPENEPELAPADLADAVGEIVNILAGSLKSKLMERDPSIRLGLPIFINGHITPTAGLKTAAAHVRFGAIEAVVMVLRAADRHTERRSDYLALPG